MTESESAPVCQTCGGSGSVQVQFARTVPDWRGEPTIDYDSDIDACPDCTGTAAPERAGDDEARTSPAEWAAMTARIRDLAGRLPAQPALSGDEPVTSPDLDALWAAYDAAEDDAGVHAEDSAEYWRRVEAARGRIVSAIRASERAAAAERERGLEADLRAVLPLIERDVEEMHAERARPNIEQWAYERVIRRLLLLRRRVEPRAAVSGEGEGQ